MTEQRRPAPGELEDWVARVSAALGLPESFSADIPAILDLARDAAHGVARPAAPLTTFLVGYAAALRGGDPETVGRLSDIAAELALSAAEGTSAPRTEPPPSGS